MSPFTGYPIKGVHINERYVFCLQVINFGYRFLRRFRAGLRFSCFLLDTGVCTDSYVG